MAQNKHKKTSINRGLRRVVILAAPPTEELDIVGPLEIFSAVNRLRIYRKLTPIYQISLVTTERKRLITGDAGIEIMAQGYYRRQTEPIDTLLIAGGSGVLEKHSRGLLDWLRQQAEQVRRIGSICTGAFLLAEAGLLDHRRATTHWLWTKELNRRYPMVQVDHNPIWIKDGHYYTSAGVTAGMDLSLALVEEDCGNAMALEVARCLVMFLRRPGGQAQFSVSLSAQAAERRAIQELQTWMADHLDQDLSVNSLAERVAMSPRNFARVFTQELGITPARYVEQLRIEAARRRLEQTNHSQDEIAVSCGFSSAELMRRAFLRTLDSTPGRYRHHFRAKS